MTSALALRLPADGDAMRHLARNSRSFRLATRFLPLAESEKVARVYAFCRVTDDLADQPDPDRRPEEMLDEWLSLSQHAYEGGVTGLALLDRTMREMADAGVPFTYVEQLVAGMRMDLRGTRYVLMTELQTYTYRVASVVGLWITELSGMHDRQVLAHASRMGHAMQLTNILRDVGEDWALGRLYLPAEVLHRYGLDARAIGAMYEGRREIDDMYRALTEHLMDVASAEYRAAFPWITELPPFLQRSVAIAARVYEGIHDAIRRNAYDNLHRRAVTTPDQKLLLVARALRDLSRARRARTHAIGSMLRTPAHPAPKLTLSVTSQAHSG
ncbi:MAG TPA: phytoene/squalene synthase family protein [Gemmatimonadaceae bacterium]|nr:phytoene/squalene synthase family protein [Gemmatimonadaceae bacterium]